MLPESTDKSAQENIADQAGDRSADQSGWLLYYGVRELLRCDEAEVVHGIANYVMSQYGILSKGANFVERCRRTPLAPFAMVLGAVTRFLEVRQSVTDGEIVWVARLENERRAIEEILKHLPAAKHCELILSRPPKAAAAGASITMLPEWRKIYQAARHLLNRDLELFRVLRVIEMIGYYAHYLHIFRSNNFRCAIMSSHSNPHGIAFNLAARRSGVPVILVTHGMPVRPVACLAYDAAIVHCRAALEIYAHEGSAIGTVFIHGRKDDYEPMTTELPSVPVTAGIFLCKDVVDTRLEMVLRALLADNRIGKVIIRPHPKNLWRGIERWLAEFGGSRVDLSISSPLRDDLQNVDLVVGGNSSVLVDAVTAGRPALYVSGLDYGNHDFHEFVERGLIREFSAANFDLEEIYRFYSQPGWAEKLKAFAEIELDRSRALQQLRNLIAERYIHKDV